MNQDSENKWIKVSSITLVFPKINTQKKCLSSGLVSKPSNQLPGSEYIVDFLKATWN